MLLLLLLLLMVVMVVGVVFRLHHHLIIWVHNNRCYACVLSPVIRTTQTQGTVLTASNAE